ncbi:hypothetical protein TOPH_06869 [Tolypocladium ophioglossoides CBS 100239]|uniref:Protein kinase domain-containing protein n=1 Tax=Tolypocladium ophioglossoides (strain CBS 100239) TaxID=1163406 RepID=A0A0L0N3E7_TOLOC|nr:hypothetical protein TOPH_06869 [Tolypocladium ophioglossoides CBS 100239]
MCGTLKYHAPEIYEDSACIRKDRKRYSPAVNTWPLGAVVYRLVFGFPVYEPSAENPWCETIVDILGQSFVQRQDELKRLLLSSMMVMSPDLRDSAQGCYNKAMDLHLTSRAQWPATDNEGEDEPSTRRAQCQATESEGEDEQSTYRAQCQATESADAEAASASKRLTFSTEPSRRARSPARSPSCVSPSRANQKRPTTETAGRRYSKRPDRHGQDSKPTSRRQPETDYPAGGAQDSLLSQDNHARW